MAGTLESIVGPGNVYDRMEILTEYSSDQSFAPPVRPQSIVKPGNRGEVELIIKWANETLTPLIPVSSGPPHFYGDTVPQAGGSVIVDLSSLKQIIRIDRRNRVATIEPGVTFPELIPALEKEGLAPLMPFMPRSSKSVLTSFLERTPITTPRFHWESMDPLCSVEVVYGNGETLWTGSAGCPGTVEEQLLAGRALMRGMGPGQVDFNRLLQGAQGTMGIVTWGTVRCRPLPKAQKMFLVPSDSPGPLTEMAYRITYKKLGEDLLILNRSNLASAVGQTKEEIGSLKAGLLPWILVLGIDGAGLLPEEKIGYQEIEASKIAHQLGLELKTESPGIDAEAIKALFHPCEGTYWKQRHSGGSSDLFFLTTMDKAEGFIDKMKELAGAHHYDASNMGVYIQPCVQGTNCHLEFNCPYEPDNPDDKRKMKEFINQGCMEIAKMGGFFSRPYGEWTKVAHGRDIQAAIGQRRIKQIFDPGGIMNPGKLCF
jgi:FAD/FMN-containing dehydrogenase